MRKFSASAEFKLIARPPVMSASRILCAQQKIGESTVPWLASVVIRHAGTFSAVTRYACDVEGAGRQREVLRFKNVSIDNSSNGVSSMSLSRSVGIFFLKSHPEKSTTRLRHPGAAPEARRSHPTTDFLRRVERMSYCREPDKREGAYFIGNGNMRLRNHARHHPFSCFHTESIISAQVCRSEIWDRLRCALGQNVRGGHNTANISLGSSHAT